jgi:transposase InsO family protein
MALRPRTPMSVRRLGTLWQISAKPVPFPARSDVFDYIECLYNPRRRHSTIRNVSPIQFEATQEA